MEFSIPVLAPNGPLWVAGNQPKVQLRPVTAADREWLFRLYATTRVAELALTGWGEPQQQQSLRFQFQAQNQHYCQQYPDAEFWVIEVDGVDAGRLTLHRTPAQLRLVEIILLPEFQRRGIGGVLIRFLQRTAAAAHCPVTLQVLVAILPGGCTSALVLLPPPAVTLFTPTWNGTPLRLDHPSPALEV